MSQVTFYSVIAQAVFDNTEVPSTVMCQIDAEDITAGISLEIRCEDFL